MAQYSGIFTPSQQMQAKAANNWPSPVTPPTDYVYFTVDASATPTIYASKDGLTWDARGTLPTLTNFPCPEIYYASGYLIVADSKQQLFRSTDQGATFTQVQGTSGVGVFMYQLAANSTGRYWCYGTDFGYRVYSTNFGVSWTTQQPTSSNIYPTIFLPNRNIFLFAADNGTRFFSSPGTNPASFTTSGQGTFTNSQYLWWATYNPVTDTAYVTSGTDSAFKVIYSTNGGGSWTSSNTYTGGYFPGQYPAVIRNTGLFCALTSSSPNVVFTTNNGSTWTSSGVAAGITVNKLAADTTKLMAATSNGIYV